MSSRLEQLTARRMRLQAQCDLQRNDVRLLYDDIEQGTGRADRVIETVRTLGPLIAAGGLVVLFVVGPGRALRLLRQGLTVGLYATHAMRMMR